MANRPFVLFSFTFLLLFFQETTQAATKRRGQNEPVGESEGEAPGAKRTKIHVNSPPNVDPFGNAVPSTSQGPIPTAPKGGVKNQPKDPG